MSAIAQLFERIPDLPAMPKVMQDLVRTMEDDSVDLSDLADTVKHDPTLSARVLRMANSAYYGATRKIGAIEDAVTRIGLNALRTLVIASGMTSTFKAVPGVKLQPFWRHALLSAALARSIARRARIDVEFSYTAALMHRIGDLLLHLAHPAEAQALAAEMADSTPAERCEAERERFGADHCAAGAELARLWQFPVAIQNALGAYAYPLSKQASPFAIVVAVSSACAQGLMEGVSGDALAEAVPAEWLEKLALDTEQLSTILDDGSAMLAEAQSFI